MYTLYILRCADNSLYTGITTDLPRRIAEHSGSVKGAKYTRGRGPVTLVFSKRFRSRSMASKVEYLIKSLSKIQKMNLIGGRMVIRMRRQRKTKRKPGELKARKAEALALVTARIEHYNQVYQLSYRNIAIKDQRSRWGSCSAKKNLNFNYRIVDLPPELVDYIVVHELCHLQEMNHSRAFWSLVAQTIPDYKKRKAMLRGHRIG